MIKAMLEYQKADAKLRDIEKTISDSDERKKAMGAKKYLETVETNVEKLNLRAEDLMKAFEDASKEQAGLKEQEQEIADAISSLEDEKETQFLIKKIDELVAKIKEVGKKLNDIQEEIKKVAADYSVIKKNTSVAQEQYKEYAPKYKELKAKFQAEKEIIEKELATLKEKVDSPLMERYLAKREKKIYPVLYSVRANGSTHSCGACNMELPMAVSGKLKNGEVIDCENCGRLLYLPKE